MIAFASAPSRPPLTATEASAAWEPGWRSRATSMLSCPISLPDASKRFACWLRSGSNVFPDDAPRPSSLAKYGSAILASIAASSVASKASSQGLTNGASPPAPRMATRTGSGPDPSDPPVASSALPVRTIEPPVFRRDSSSSSNSGLSPMSR